MTSSDLDRVQKDLEVIQQALGAESPVFPANWRKALRNVLLLMPLVLWSTIGPGTYMSLAIIVTLLALAAAGIGEGRAYLRERGEHPARWREWRRQMAIPLWAAPSVMLLGYWAVANGVPPRTLVGLTLAIAGGVCVYIGCRSVIRRDCIPFGLAMIACGLAVPWYTDRQIGLGFALMFLVAELTSWALAARQLRRVEKHHVTS